MKVLRRRRSGELAGLREASLAAAAAAEQARAAALRAEQAAVAARKALEDQKPGEERNGGRLIRLSLACVALTLLALFCILHGIDAFRDPPAISTNFGAVGVYLQAQPPSSPSQVNKLQVTGIAALFEPDENYADYEVLLPISFVGKKFVVTLQDDAVLRAVSGSVPLTVSEPLPCSNVVKAGSTAYSTPHICQVIHGTVPSSSPYDTTQCDPNTDGLLGSWVMVDITGDSANQTSLDWAHKLVTLPGLVDPDGGPVGTTLSDWDGVSLKGPYDSTTQETCKVATAPIGTIMDTNPVPTERSSFYLTWAGIDGAVNTDVVFSVPNAESWGNFCVAFGGIVAALGIGFVPVAYEAWRSWRRDERERRKPAG